MAERLGSGEWTYEVNVDWAKIPDEIVLGDCAAVGVDSRGNVYAFNRGEHPVAVFDNGGNLLRTWGEGVFTRPHGVHVAPDDTIWLTDDGDHTVRQCTLDGKFLLTIGIPGKPAPFMSGEPFHRCTHTALSPQCDHVYVSDGYGNARVHKYAPDGRHLLSWGECGTAPGQFNLVHNISCDPDGWVYVADRENHRIQVFDGDGKYEAQFNNLHRPCGIFMPYCSCPVCYVGELGPATRTNRNYPNLGPRLSIIDNKGNLLARIGGQHPGTDPLDYIGPHGLAVDSRGDIYVGEVSRTLWPQYWPDQPVPDNVRVLRKLRKIS
jgi:DNA-binding beta-propeller fold protein YncE